MLRGDETGHVRMALKTVEVMEPRLPNLEKVSLKGSVRFTIMIVRMGL